MKLKNEEFLDAVEKIFIKKIPEKCNKKDC